MDHVYDIAVIGAGVTGCAVARELTRFTDSVCVIEKETDVCCGTSKANSAIIHAGYDAANGSLMAKYNVEGSRIYPVLARELNFHYDQIGSLVVCTDAADMPSLKKLYENGIKNGVERLEIIDTARLRHMEPNISAKAVAALWAPTGAIVCPFDLTCALAENAFKNGARFMFEHAVSGIERSGDMYIITAGDDTVSAKYVVNAAGVYADVIHNMVSAEKISITPRRGQYLLLDHTAGTHVSHTVFQLPGKLGKGVLVTPTVHGNLLIGPTAEDTDDKDDTATTAAGLSEVMRRSAIAVDNIPLKQVITSFSGTRAHERRHEFIVGEVPDAHGFYDCAGIESPGLSSAPAIARDIAEMIALTAGYTERVEFDPYRKAPVDCKRLTDDEYSALIRRDPEYGRIVCRCERVTAGEIRDAIRRMPGAVTLDGIKRRVRAGMGICQGGFCSPAVMNILSEELKIPLENITKNGPGSEYITAGTEAVR